MANGGTEYYVKKKKEKKTKRNETSELVSKSI